jgi:hypothetical protein
MHTVTEVELDTVASLSNSVHLGLLGISAGALIAFAITLLTVDITDPTVKAIMASLTWVSAIFSLYFGARATLDYRAAQQKLREIKRGY